MKIQKKYGFTLIELVISVVLLLIILTGISYSIFNLSSNVEKTSYETKIFDNFNEFILDTKFFYYSSGLIISSTGYYDTVVLYNSNNAYLIGAFNDPNGGKDYKLSQNKNIYKRDYFGYFQLNKSILDNILSNTGSIYSLNYNNGKIFKSLIINDIGLNTYNSGSIFEVNLSTIKSFNKNYEGKDKVILNISPDDLLNFNVFF